MNYEFNYQVLPNKTRVMVFEDQTYIGEVHLPENTSVRSCTEAAQSLTEIHQEHKTKDVTVKFNTSLSYAP